MKRHALSPAHGQAMAEHLVLLALVTALVAMPVGDAPSVVALLLDAVRTAWLKFFSALALAA
jgi:hypothetical protein